MLDIRLMRRLDSVLGNLACNALALQKRLRGTANGGDSARPVRKIAVMKFFGMGSIVVATPCLQALREQFPGAEIHFVTFKGNRELLEILSLTDKNHFVDPSSPRSFIASTLTVAKRLREEGIDLALDLEFFAKFPLVLASLAGIPRKAGFYLTAESWRKTMLDVTGWYNHYFHTKDIFLSLVYLLAKDDPYYVTFEGFAKRYSYPQLSPSDAERRSLRAKLVTLGVKRTQTLYVVNPNTSPELAPEARKWPEERYAELGKALLAKDPNAVCLFIGAPSERQYVQRIAARGNDARMMSVAGEFSLRELVVLFAETRLLVSNDSGPMHLACLVDAPTIGLFFADTPTLFAPIGTHVGVVAPALYSMPLFSVYNGKDVVVGKPTDEIKNVAARTVSLEQVLTVVDTVLLSSKSKFSHVSN
jgi:ADP-heptose:LPS heptosyltransferase